MQLTLLLYTERLNGISSFQFPLLCLQQSLWGQNEISFKKNLDSLWKCVIDLFFHGKKSLVMKQFNFVNYFHSLYNRGIS